MPVYRMSNKSELKNHRPVTLLSSLSKVSEKICIFIDIGTYIAQ